MQRSTIILLALAFCLLTSFTTRAQGSYTGQPMYEEDYGDDYKDEEEEKADYGKPAYEEEEEESYTYGGKPVYEEEEEKYEEKEEYYEEKEEYQEEKEEYYEEKEEYYEEKEEYQEEKEEYYEEEKDEYYEDKPYGYTEAPSYEEEYEEYAQENYDYNSGNYGGGSAPSYGAGNSSYGYGNNEGYNGSYNSNTEEPEKAPKFPTSLLTGFVVDIHFLAVDIHFQYIAYHYCSELFAGYTQCAIYNGTSPNSRLVATEIVVSAEIFKTLPLAERKLYHSHAYAVKNGLLVLPGVPPEQELEVMAGVANTYGKVVDYWHSYQDFPLGPPRLAYGLADDSQLNTTVIKQMDQALNLGTTWLERKKQRENIKWPTIIDGADDYLTSGKYPQYVIKEFDVPKDD